jgi:hypothetical protein
MNATPTSAVTENAGITTRQITAWVRSLNSLNRMSSLSASPACSSGSVVSATRLDLGVGREALLVPAADHAFPRVLSRFVRTDYSVAADCYGILALSGRKIVSRLLLPAEAIARIFGTANPLPNLAPS